MESQNVTRSIPTIGGKDKFSPAALRTLDKIRPVTQKLKPLVLKSNGN